MLEVLLTWLTSLRVRLIVTYVAVAAFSFGLLLILLMGPISRFFRAREEEKLKVIGITLASTIRSSVEFSPVAFEQDQLWTLRRVQLYLTPMGGDRENPLPNTHFRLLGTDGRPVMDSWYPKAPDESYTQYWARWKVERERIASLRDFPEVLLAMRGHYAADTHGESPRKTLAGIGRMYIAIPIFRTPPSAKIARLAFIMYIDRPLDSVEANLLAIRRIIIYEMLGSLLITVLVSILLSSSLSSGLQSAMRLARAIAAGRMDLRMRDKGWDELGQLGKAFNQMADALQRQEQLRRDLLADVSHELRTPLTAITGCADTLTDGAIREDPEAAEHFLRIIQRESERLQRLVTDILELSKLQTGVLDIPLSPLPICPLIEDAVDVARLHARNDKLTIRYVAPDAEICDALLVLGNEDRLAQALRNLLDNARHHTPAERTISVLVEPSADAVIIRVQDEGEGIPPENLPWVFDRFYRAGKGNKQAGGTGLGLAIVREIMHLHRGDVTVESTVGVGTTFSLHLRRVEIGKELS